MALANRRTRRALARARLALAAYAAAPSIESGARQLRAFDDARLAARAQGIFEALAPTFRAIELDAWEVADAFADAWESRHVCG